MKTNELVKTGLMLALALVFQIGFRQFAQPLVGPLVNMVLLLTVLYVSVPSAVTVGVVTPVVAFVLGLMPLAPIVPVIAIGNALLVVMFGFTVKFLLKYKWRNYVAVLVAAVFKFVFLFTAVRYLVPVIIGKSLPAPILGAFGVAQLYTALVGGALALVLYLVLPIKKAPIQ